MEHNKKRRVRLKINPQCFFLLSSVLILVYVYLLDRIDFSFHQQELSNNNRNVVSRTSTISVDNFTKLNNNNNRVVSSYEPKQSPSPLRTTTLKKHQQNTSDNNTTEIQQQQQLQMHEGPTMPPQSSSYDTFGFIHIGKTAGSTISNLLRNGCHSLTKSCRKNIPNESTVSKLVKHYYHIPDFWRLPTSNHRGYIISVRDPYERSVSALLYHHPDNIHYYNLTVPRNQKDYNQLAYQCFPTLEVFASLLESKTSDSNSCDYPYPHSYVDTSNCSELACAVIHGKVRFFNHLFFNYGNILSKIRKHQQQIYAIRQEYLWHDWSVINKMLYYSERKEEQSPSSLIASGTTDSVYLNTGSTGDSSTATAARNISHLVLPVTRDISDNRRMNLCTVLETEYQAYFQILNRAINIDDVDMKNSIRIASSKCLNLDMQYILEKSNV